MDDVNMKIEDVSCDVTTLLLEWDCAELIPKFIENDVDLETLRLMKPCFVSKILEGFKWKTQIKFEHYHDIWQKAQKDPDDPGPSTSSAPTFARLDSRIASPQLRMISPQPLVIPIPKENDNDAIIIDDCYPVYRVPSPPQPLLVPQPIETAAGNYSIKATHNRYELVRVSTDQLLSILQSKAEGKFVLSFYQINGELDKKARKTLIDCIVQSFTNNGQKMSVSIALELANEITRLFPNEKKEYYCNPRKGKAPLGVLLCAYHHHMKKFRRSRRDLLKR